jgi:hypothetical protein
LAQMEGVGDTTFKIGYESHKSRKVMPTGRKW